MTSSDIIRMVLHNARGRYMAVFEITGSARLQGHWISDNAAASRLCIDLKGEAVGRYREGKRFKEWAIPLPQSQETQPGPAGAAPLFFFSVGDSAIPSPYFYSLSALVDSV